MDNNDALQLVLGIALLLAALGTVGAWILFRWRRRPAVAPAQPAPDVVESLSDAPTMAHQYPLLPHPDEERFDEVPQRADWQPKIHPTRLRRWERQRQGRVFLGDDRG